MSTGPTKFTREVVLERDGYQCVSCGVNVMGKLYSIHHRIPRGMGGTRRPEVNLPANLLLLCGTGTTGCHGWVESHRMQARDWGYLIRRDTAKPSWEPVFTANGWRRFDDEGGWAEAYPTNSTPERARELEREIERARLTRMGEAR